MRESSNLLSVGQVLTLDETYRRKVKGNEFCEDAYLAEGIVGEGELPVMRQTLKKAQVTVFFTPVEVDHYSWASGMYDWVEVHWKSVSGQSAKWTVVTEWREGPLQGRRIVRGREEECRAYYAELAAQRIVEKAVDILKAELGFSSRQAHQAICAQASGQNVLLPDVAAVIVETDEIEGQYAELFDAVTFDRRPWCRRREEALTRLSTLLEDGGNTLPS